MVVCMKTTVEISDSLLKEAKRVAAKERTTVRRLVEEGLRRTIADRKKKEPFRLRRATFKGKGLQPHVADLSWDRIRDLVYERRGG